MFFWLLDLIFFAFVLHCLNKIFQHWNIVEALLRYKLASILANELDMDVSLRSLRISFSGLLVEGLAVGFKSKTTPYTVKVGKIEFKPQTQGIWGLANIVGIINLGSVIVPFLIGFKTRCLDSVELTDVVTAFIDQDDDDDTDKNDDKISRKKHHHHQFQGGGKLAATNLLVPKFLAAKNKIDKRGHALAEAKLEADRENVPKEWNVDFTEDQINNYLKHQRRNYIYQADWNIKRFIINQIDLYLYDHCLHLDHWQSNPKTKLFGSTHHIQVTLALGIMNDMIGPAAVVKNIHSQVTLQVQQLHRDFRRFQTSVVHVQPSTWSSRFYKFLYKKPHTKLTYKQRRRQRSLFASTSATSNTVISNSVVNEQHHEHINDRM
uniref:Uncharacterized protein n=1 Tax=Aureoumbra lagunensis TaxID=44058 RepID=A0A7S3K2W1_9STRA|mmetsp:Transcript_1404/g.1832  ORF Transcript_1404/g.1832 Transcript_1404/m.1832 type:complete len:378 (+) Transcript_1404:39-1172(+)